LDRNFAPFLAEGVEWGKYSRDAPLRGFTPDVDPVPEVMRRTAEQKVCMLELMLGQIANYCPIISRNNIVKKSTSVNCIWQVIRAHFGFQSTGGHFLDLADFQKEPDERPEDLFQRLTAFVEDNLLTRNGGITHNGDAVEADEEMTPTLENFIVVVWLKLIHKDLPRLVKQKYGTELRARTLASIKPEISQALNSLLDDIHIAGDARAMRSFAQSKSVVGPHSDRKYRSFHPRKSFKCCPLCKQSGRSNFNHFLSECEHLPESDKRYMSKTRLIANILDSDEGAQSDVFLDEGLDEGVDYAQCHHSQSAETSPVVRKVMVSQSPYLDVFYRHHTPRIIIDSGATANLIRKSTADALGVRITQSSQSAGQADGLSQLSVSGETRFIVSRNNTSLTFHGLVVENLDVPILAGIPFMEVNDIHTRPAKREVYIGESIILRYGSNSEESKSPAIRRACVLRGPAQASTVWPGEFLEVEVPSSVVESDATVAVEPRVLDSSCDGVKASHIWPPPAILSCLDGKVRIPNFTNMPKVLKRHEHFCQVRPVFCPLELSIDSSPPPIPVKTVDTSKFDGTYYSDSVTLDPENFLPLTVRESFVSALREFDDVFNPAIGCYNGAVGPFQAVVNMGPVQPPQRKGRIPQYSRDRLVELQQKLNDLESMGVIVKPEDAKVCVEYLNPSFLVKKPTGGSRLVTAFGEVGQYSKPQPSLMPDVDSTLYKIGQWKYLVASDLTSAFYQIPLSPDSMKYCGIVTPFQGIRVYARSAMGMPGSETALEELMCRVLGDLLEEGVVAKLADDLYCGGNTPQELLQNWRRVLHAISKCGLRLSAVKTIICPKSTSVLGWQWHLGTLQASPHRIATLSTCSPPTHVKSLRSFIGAYKFLTRVIPKSSLMLTQLESTVAGKQSQDEIVWSDSLYEAFHKAQKALLSHHTISIPRPNDQLWLVTDGAVRDPGIGATLYLSRHSKDGDKLLLGGFFSSKLRNRQVTWLPCEIEALAIASAVKHFSPYIIQSHKRTCILTDSKPCVQSYQRLCRGEFSASPRLSTFLATVSRYQVSVIHLAGRVNVPSDFASRNAPPCDAPQCQVCIFVNQSEDSVIFHVSIDDLLAGGAKLPFTTRSTWLSVQSECADLRRTHAHLKQGTRPSKKITNIRDIRRYLNVATLSRDGLVVVSRSEPLASPRECIVVPRQVLHGLLTALHVKLNHPSSFQMKSVVQRFFYALDLSQAVSQVTLGCHHCASLQSAPHFSTEQSTSDPPEAMGTLFAADVLKRESQLVLVLRECVSSYTVTCLIDNEQRDTLRSALIFMCLELRPLDGPPAVIRTDCASGFSSLADDDLLKYHNIAIELGRPKNINKNPIAERAVQEVEMELRRDSPRGGQVTTLSLAVATARLNSRIRASGFSARELWLQRDQFTNTQLPFSDQEVIRNQHERRCGNHTPSERSKAHGHSRAPSCELHVGDIVYLYSDLSKVQGRDRYLVTTVEGAWCCIRKFVGAQLRNTSYRVRRTDCYKVPAYNFNSLASSSDDLASDEELPCVPTPVTLPRPSLPDNSVVSNTTEPLIPSRPPDIPSLISMPEQQPAVIEPLETTLPTDVELSNTPSLGAAESEAVQVSSFDSHDNEPVSPVSPVPLRRPTRTRRPPSYLQDYIRD